MSFVVWVNFDAWSFCFNYKDVFIYTQIQAHFCILGNSVNDISYSFIVNLKVNILAWKWGWGDREKEGENMSESANEQLSERQRLREWERKWDEVGRQREWTSLCKRHRGSGRGQGGERETGSHMVLSTVPLNEHVPLLEDKTGDLNCPLGRFWFLYTSLVVILLSFWVWVK